MARRFRSLDLLDKRLAPGRRRRRAVALGTAVAAIALLAAMSAAVQARLDTLDVRIARIEAAFHADAAFR